MLYSSRDHQLVPCQPESLLLSPVITPYQPHFLDSDLFDIDCYSDKEDHNLMSTPSLNFTDPAGEYASDSIDFQDYQGSSHLSDYQPYNTASPNTAWQFWHNGAFGHNAQTHPEQVPQTPHQQQQQQHNFANHRRAFSNSSDVSYTPDSPYSHASSIQYPSTYNHNAQYLTPSWEGYSSLAAAGHHLPTPINSPRSDTFMEDKSRRRPTATTKADSALAAHRSMRSALTHQSSSGNVHSSGNPYPPIATSQTQILPPTQHQAGSGETSNAQNGNNGEIGFASSDFWQCVNSLFDEPIATRHVPKFDRTMSDIYQDELYNPQALASTSASGATAAKMPAQYQQHNAAQRIQAQHQQQQQAFLTPPQSLVSDRLNAAYLERSTSPGHAPRGPSPFAQGSPYAAPLEVDTNHEQPRTAAAIREQNKIRADAIAYAQHHSRGTGQQAQTVSPKDTYPEEYAPEEENMPSLFPASSNQSGTSETTATYGPHNAERPYDFNSSIPYGSLGFATPSIPASQLPDLNNVGVARRRGLATASKGSAGDAAFSDVPPPRLVSMETTHSESEEESEDEESYDLPAERPADMTARGGTYTCTYHGCTERFITPAELQKHKRESHRSTGATGIGSSSLADLPMSPGSAMTQAGPHKCTRINPSNNKPCNTVFSRPYDLTRHEDTIHAERKKVRCPHCTEDKTFSRADALTRHLRVVHPHVSFPGKHRRRHD